jgi:hypothetical protein
MWFRRNITSDACIISAPCIYVVVWDVKAVRIVQKGISTKSHLEVMFWCRRFLASLKLEHETKSQINVGFHSPR